MSQLVLYSYFRSSASYRVRIALNLKGLAYEYRAVHLLNNGGEQHSEAYRQLNPSREVPTLVHGDKIIGQSMAIIDYLDHVFSGPRLFPAEPYERAKVMQACEIVNSGAQPVHNLRVLQELERRFQASAEAKDAWATHWIRYGLEALESFLQSNAGRFSFGDQVSAADCFLIPHLANADRYKIPVEPYPTLSRIRQSCQTVAAFAQAAPSAQPDFPKES